MEANLSTPSRRHPLYLIYRAAMKIIPQLLGFDIDGVVADTMEAFIRLAHLDHGVGPIAPEEITDFSVEKCLALPAAIIAAIFGRLLDEPLAAGLKPMADAVSTLQALAVSGPLTFITARPNPEPISRWLRVVLGEEVFRKVDLVAMGEHDGKLAFIKERGLQYFIDDRAETCLHLHAHGITPFVYNQPWNRGRHELQNVDDWRAIRALCAS